MDNHTSILGRWNICLSLLVPFFLSACSEEKSSTNTTREARGSTEPDKIVNARNNTPPGTEHQNTIILANIPATRFDEPGWGTAKLIETDNTGDALWPRIAFDNSGNALAVWAQSDGTRMNIWANRFDGAGWGSAELIETDDAGDALWPRIAFDNNGNALVVWAQSDGTHMNIRANRFDGAGWGSAELIETDNAGDALWPQVAFDNSGNALAVWAQSDGTRMNIWANRFDGAGWGSAKLIETDNAGDALWPRIAFDNSDNALAVWAQSDGTRINIQANRFDGSAWNTAKLIETDNAGDALWPQVAFNNSGSAFAIWAQSNGTRYSIRTNRFDGTSWSSTERIGTGNAEDAFKPQITFDNSGNALALWGQYDGIRTNIWANRFNGAGWDTAELIETDNRGDAFGPRVAFDRSGNAFAVWVQNDGSRYNIRTNRFNGSGWSTAELIETDNRGDASRPQIALDSNGNALAVWKQYDGIRENIRANRFE